MKAVHKASAGRGSPQPPVVSALQKAAPPPRPLSGFERVSSGVQLVAYLFSGRAAAFNLMLILIALLIPTLRDWLLAFGGAVPELPHQLSGYSWVLSIAIGAMSVGVGIREGWRSLLRRAIEKRLRLLDPEDPDSAGGAGPD